MILALCAVITAAEAADVLCLDVLRAAPRGWQLIRLCSRAVPNGDRYVGDWRADEPAGRGVLHRADGSSSAGQFARGLPNGKGVLRLVSGESYDGEFKEGRRHGRGVAEMSDADGGGLYDGEWADDKRNGSGRCEWPDGRVHVGHWLDGAMHGEGLMTWPSKGDGGEAKARGAASGRRRSAAGRVVGGAGSDEPSARLTPHRRRSTPGPSETKDAVDGEKSVDGGVYLRWEGVWMNGRRWKGTARILLPNGSTYDGDEVDGQRSGKGLLRYADGGTYEGDFKNGKQHGHGRRVWANGDVCAYQQPFGEMLRTPLPRRFRIVAMLTRALCRVVGSRVAVEGKFKKNKMGEGKRTYKDSEDSPA